MDKELIQRLTLAARFPQPPAQEHMATFAALVAEECAKALEQGHTFDLHDKFGDKPVTYHRPPDPMAAAFLRRRFGTAAASRTADEVQVLAKGAAASFDRSIGAAAIAARRRGTDLPFFGMSGKPLEERPAPPDWKAQILRALRILQKYPVSKVQTTGQRADGSRVAYSFDPQWLRDNSDQDVLEAIEIMEAKR